MGSMAILSIGIVIIFIAFLGLILTVGVYVSKKRRADKRNDNGNVVVRKPVYVMDSFPM